MAKVKKDQKGSSKLREFIVPDFNHTPKPPPKSKKEKKKQDDE